MAIGLGFAAELETQLIIANEIKYLTIEEQGSLLNNLEIIMKMIKRLSISIKGWNLRTKNQKPKTKNYSYWSLLNA